MAGCVVLFADAALVRRIENAECRMLTDVAERIGARALTAPIAGGVAVHIGEEAPFNKMIGVGLDGPFDEAATGALEAIERAFDARRAPLQAEIATLADFSVPTLLARRGYELVGFENVLALALDDAARARLAANAPPASVRVAPCEPREADAWIDAIATGFAQPDAVPGGGSHESFPREAIERSLRHMAFADGFRPYVARWDGAIAGAAGMRAHRGVAQLCGAATLPAMRRRGVQNALLAARLADAIEAGSDIAVITTQPGSKSQENAQRRGFALVYARAILRREPRAGVTAI